MKKLSDGMLLAHYGLARGSYLTNLGVLLVGTKRDRARVGASVQAVKYEDERTVVRRWEWADHRLWELPDVIWSEVATFREGYDMPDGMVRTKEPAFDERVVRALLVNALVHRAHALPGKVELRLYPDRLELTSPGRFLPPVSRKNVLRARLWRNPRLACVFADFGLTEGDGTGIDEVFARLLATGRPALKRKACRLVRHAR